jgi:hypothetical protein
MARDTDRHLVPFQPAIICRRQVSVEGRWRVILDSIACTDDLITITITITITIVVLAVAVVVAVDVVIAHSVTRPPTSTYCCSGLVARKITLGRLQVHTPGRKAKQSGRDRLQE